MKRIKEWLYPWLQRLRYARLLVWFCLYPKKPQAGRNRVLFFSSERTELAGNLRFVYDAIQRLRPELDCTVLLRPDIRGARRLAKALAQSSTILIDDFEPRLYVLPLARHQRLVQVWHAMGAFKRVGFARENASRRSLSHRNYTHVIVSAGGIRQCYADSFGVPVEKVHAWGIPRTDAFFDEQRQKQLRGQLFDRYPVLRSKKLLLFAPTFRGNNRNEGYYPPEYLNIPALYEALGGEYVLGVKLHPLIQNTLTAGEACREFVLDFSEYREVNDLLSAASVLITDYSSVIFENALLETPVVFYVPDYEEYVQARGFYFPFETYVYGPVAKNTQELVEAVSHACVDEDRLKAFRKQFIEHCDGSASGRVVRHLFP